jgi:TolB protein
MKTPSRRPWFLCLPIALLAVFCFIASLSYERVAAQLNNGKIAFTSNGFVYTINPDGSGVQQLTPNGFSDAFPAWSPDGAKIVFGRTASPVKSQIYVMNADGTNPIRITNNSFTDKDPAWSPDGTRIAFVSDRDGNDEIYVMNADGSNQTRLTNNNSVDIDPAWSPDGTKIAFSTTRDVPGPLGNFNVFEIYVMGADGSNPIRLTNNGDFDGDPSWSPDGTKIAFTSQRDGLPIVYVMNPNGSNQVSLAPSPNLDSKDPEWSPDGTTIAFTSFNRVTEINSHDIFLMNTDGSNIRRLQIPSLDEHDLAWQPTGGAPLPTPTPTPTPSPSPLLTISGTVTDGAGHGLADVTMVLVSDVTGTQIALTNQSGNYVLTYAGGVSHRISVTPAKTGYVFNPLSITFISTSSLNSNFQESFEGTQIPIPVLQTPYLLTQENSLRALALDSVTRVSEPFAVTNINNFSSDQDGRVSLFAVNMDLAAGENFSVIEAQAEDSQGQIFPLTVEHFSAVPNFSWLKQVVVNLPDAIANKTEVRVNLKFRGNEGNKVTVKVKP